MKIVTKKLTILSGLLLIVNLNAQVIQDGAYFIASKHSANCVELESSKETLIQLLILYPFWISLK